MYNEEFDALKTKILKYIVYKKRTEREIRKKFNTVDENMLEEAIEYLKEAGYIDDNNYIDRAVQEFMNINTLSMQEIRYKLMSKGIDNSLIENYFSLHIDELEEYEATCAQKIYNKKIANKERIQVIDFLRKKGYKDNSIKSLED